MLCMAPIGVRKRATRITTTTTTIYHILTIIITNSEYYFRNVLNAVGDPP